MKLKLITVLFYLTNLVVSQDLTDTTNVKANSSINKSDTTKNVDTEFEQEFERLNISLLMIDSLLNTKASQASVEEKITKFNLALSGIQNDIRNSSKTIDNKIKTLEKELESRTLQLKSAVNQDINKSNLRIDELREIITTVSDSISATANTIISVKSETDTKISSIYETISKHKLYWAIAIMFILLIVIAVFLFLKLKMIEQSDSLSAVKSTQEKLENEAIKLDEQIIDLIEKQLSVLELQPQQSKEIDHSLPIKLGEEIHRMRKRLKTMEESQGTKVLDKRIESLEEKLNDMGYEIVNLEGKPFYEGMTVKGRFIPDENLKDGEEIITRVIKPQIDYKGILVQAADVDISQGNKIKK
ncbi:MAG: hypothetical protein H8D45_26025 [Bacteroidetes bacterium]|nr:hypothetical protein [Bacteroidota bacterium]